MINIDRVPLIEQQWQTRLQARENIQQRRYLREPLEIDFCSNDYLGWADLSDFLYEPTVEVSRLTHKFLTLAQRCINLPHYNGATGSRLLSGQQPIISEIEAAIAQFHQAQATLIFNSGFDANIGVLTAIADRHTVFLYDELCHASLIDGLRLSISRYVYKFRHNDMTHLHNLLQQNAGKAIVIVCESVYSMDGDCAPLMPIVDLAQAYNACVVVDEAHATGVIGERGEGLSQSLQLHDKIHIRIYTYGKALGCHGAAVVGSKKLIDLLINFARPFIYSTALPLASYAAIARSYACLELFDVHRVQLQQRIAQFRILLAQYDWLQYGVYWLDSNTAIQGLIIGDVSRIQRLTQVLYLLKMDVRPIFSPTVAAGTERLRVCLHRTHSFDQLNFLCDTLYATLKELVI